MTDYTQLINAYTDMARSCNAIDPALYGKFDVKRGLRDINGNGVLAGLTEISEVCSHKLENGEKVPCIGELYYRGINVKDIVTGFISEDRYGFEEVCYLLLFGKLPDKKQYQTFCDLLNDLAPLPEEFVRNTIMNTPSPDMMNCLARGVLTLYAYDPKADDTSMENVVFQSLRLIAQFPSLAVYGYRAYSHYYHKKSLVIRGPRKGLSVAENILRMLRKDASYTELEARLLDLALVLHAEHGGGNNSSFTTHVVTSSGTDTYSSVAASLGSLKGPRHGGANIKVVRMFDDIKENVKNWQNDSEISDYLAKILNKEAFDRSGLIYGMGHAVYSLSDPRASILKRYAKELAVEKGLTDEFALYEKVEQLAPQVIASVRRIYKGVSANVDFYSGFVYRMLNLPPELYTPLFAVARIVGWSAHRLEEINNAGKIIRPAYKAIKDQVPYEKMDRR